MVSEPKPKKSGRRRVKDLNTPLTINDKKASKAAQDLLRERKQDLKKAQDNYWSTKSKIKDIDKAMMADSVGTVAGALMGTTTVTSYVAVSYTHLTLPTTPYV